MDDLASLPRYISPMSILTEPTGSIPRPNSPIETILGFQAGKTSDARLEAAYASRQKSDSSCDVTGIAEETPRASLQALKQILSAAGRK
jgi:hypothetical protein